MVKCGLNPENGSKNPLDVVKDTTKLKTRVCLKQHAHKLSEGHLSGLLSQKQRRHTITTLANSENSERTLEIRWKL